LGAPAQTSVGVDEGKWWNGTYYATAVVGQCVRKCEPEEGLGTENPKPSRCGLVLGLPIQTAVEGGGRR
jgi:hypothetical protein